MALLLTRGAIKKLFHPRNPEDHAASRDHFLCRRPALARHFPRRGNENRLRQGLVQQWQGRPAIRPYRRLSAAAPVDRRYTVDRWQPHLAGTGLDDLWLAAGAGLAWQGADR